MFLLVSNDRQSRVFLSRPATTFTAGALLCSFMLISGPSPYFMAGFGLPVFESMVKTYLAPRVSDKVVLIIAVGVLIAHACALAMAQNAVPIHAKLAVNLSYLGSIFVGVAVASFQLRIVGNKSVN